MNILIVGCKGQLGNELQLLQSKYPYYHFFYTDYDTLDITNEEEVQKFISRNKINGIINCAAYTAVDKAEEDIKKATLLNAIAPGYLAKAIEKQKGFIIQISTDYVFDGENYFPYNEECETIPQSIYGKTKLEGEKAVINSCRHALIIRTSWLYSRFGNNFVKTMLRLGNEKKELNVIFDQVGTPTSAKDLAQTIMQIIEQGIITGIYHYSNEGVTSWYDFTKTIFEISKIYTCKVNPILTTAYPTPAKRPHYSVLDKTKIKSIYNIKIPYWQDSLKEMLTHLL